ncbi:TINCR ubiquitin domain containing [Ambystoma mexicanum]|uniref:TINCR ubiquitin domain containing n=1 Tax=Ambystoma mexicanum TaxID=8296 RepID=UPI0037E9AFCD
MEKVRRLTKHWVKYEILVHFPEDGRMLPISVKATDTMKDLRVHLVKQGVTSWKKYFFYNGVQLGEHETVKSVNIKDGAVILLVSGARRHLVPCEDRSSQPLGQETGV